MSWNKIDNLLKKTEAFYKKALWACFTAEAQGKFIKTAETHEEKAKRIAKEKEARQKAIKEQADAFLRANKPKKEERLEPETYVSPDDAPESEAPVSEAPESELTGDVGLYPEIKETVDATTNLSVAEELSLIGELYKKAIKENRGFAYLAQAISAADNMIGDEYAEYEDEEDKDYDDLATVAQDQKRQGAAIERLINNLYVDIKNRAAQSGTDLRKRDDESVISEFKDLKNQVLLDQKKRRESGEGLTPGQIADLESGGEFGNEDVDEKGQLDRGEIAGKRAPEGGSTPGMGVVDIYAPKEWAKSYKGDMERHMDELENTTDPVDRKNLTDLIAILKQLHDITVEKEAFLSDPTTNFTIKPKIMNPDGTVLAPREKVLEDPAQKEKYDSILAKQTAIKQKKSALTAKLRSHKASKENALLAARMQTAGPKEKLLLQQKILLNDLIKSNDKRKRRELDLRRQFVNTLGGNIDPTDPMYKNMQNPEEYLPSVPPEHINLMLSKIAEAAKLKISSYEANVEQAEKIKKEFEYRGAIRGEPISVEGIFIQFKQSIPSIKMGIKKTITAQFRESKNTLYDPFREAISLALQSGDAAAVERAEKAYQKQLNNDAEKHPAIQSFITYSEAFIRYLEQLKALHKEESKSEENGMVLLSATDPSVIQNLLKEGKRLFELEMVRNPGNTRKGISNVAKALEIIIRQLGERLSPSKVRVDVPQQQVRVAPQEEQEETFEEPQLKQQVVKGFNHMSLKNKLAALQAVLDKQEALQKLADENADTNFYAETAEQLGGEPPQTQMSKAEADAQADKIMDSIIDNLKIKGLDY